MPLDLSSIATKVEHSVSTGVYRDIRKRKKRKRRARSKSQIERDLHNKKQKALVKRYFDASASECSSVEDDPEPERVVESRVDLSKKVHKIEAGLVSSSVDISASTQPAPGPSHGKK